jgi:hypothetical protein
MNHIQKLLIIANKLDKLGLYKYADDIDEEAKKFLESDEGKEWSEDVWATEHPDEKRDTLEAMMFDFRDAIHEVLNRYKERYPRYIDKAGVHRILQLLVRQVMEDLEGGGKS